MKNLTIEAVAKAVDGELYNAENALPTALKTEIKGAVIDSRLVEEGYLFFATKGERVDGHDFIKDVLEKKASCVVCERVPEDVTGICILVKDSFVALKKLALFYRQQLDIKVVGITGSVGKTTTKEFIASVLAQKYSVLKTDKNFNNEVGLPLTVLKIRDEHEVAVLEMGISDFGEMSRLSEIAKPDIMVITNIGQCHLEKLGDRDGVLRAKTECFANLNEGGSAILFGDDDKLITIDNVNGQKPVFYGMNDTNDYYARDVINRGLWGSEVTIAGKETQLHVNISLPGKHMIYNAIAATAVGRSLSLNDEEICAGIEAVSSMGGRSNIVQKNNIVVIDDCYNANPVSTKAAIDLLSEAITPKVAILGDMYELGDDTAILHRGVGTYAAEKKINAICLIGELSKHTYAGALSVKDEDSNMQVVYYPTVEEAIEHIGEIIKKDDTVLIKASHGMHFEKIVEYITGPECENRFETRTERLFKGTDDTKEAGKQEPVDDSSVYVAPKKEGMDAWVKPITEAKAKKTDEEQKSAWRIVLICVIITACIVLGIILFITINKKKNYDAVTRGELIYTDDGVLTGKGTFENFHYSEDASAIFLQDTVKTPRTDGKYLYFLKKEDEYSQEFDVYCTTLGGKKEKKVLENVTQFDVLKKGELIYRENGSLYVKDVKNEEVTMVASDVFGYILSEDKQAVLLLLQTANSELEYMQIGKPDSVKKLAEYAAFVRDYDDRFDNVIFTDNEGFKFSKKRSEPVLITEYADDIWLADKNEATKIYYKQGNDLYYSNGKKSELILSNVVEFYGDKQKDGYMVKTGDSPDKLYVVYEGKYAECKDFTPGTVSGKVFPDLGHNVVYFSNTDSEGINNLYYVDTSIVKKGTVSIKDNQITDVIYIDDNNMVVCKDGGNGTRDLYNNYTLIARNVVPESVKKTEYKDAFVFAYYVSDSQGFYKLAVSDSRGVNDIGSTVDYKSVVAMAEDKIMYMAVGNSMFNVYEYNGKKSKIRAESVDGFNYLKW